ncbi:MAG: SRPBCC family protein [Methylovirgula sp.]
MRGQEIKALRVAGLVLGLIVASAAAPSVALAHGPTRQKTTQSVEISAPAAKVWSVIGNFQDMSWLAGVLKTTGKGGNEPEVAKRELTLQSGATIEESLYRYDAQEMSYSYRIDKVDVKVLPVHDYSSTIDVVAEGDGKSKVEWRGAFYRGYMLNDPPPALNDDAALKAVDALYRAALDGLKKRIEATR